MELDFKSVRALSSPTRVKILKQVIGKEATPTLLSEDLGKSKSTISSHLDKLVEADLVEKDEKEGRKRVVYSPTRKADAIVNGKERRVKFTLASSVVSLFAGVLLLGESARKIFFPASSSSGGDAAIMTQEAGIEAARDTASQSSQLMQFSPDILLFFGIGLLCISAISFLYGITIKKLTERSESY